jgi:hypothetical protein
MDDGAAPWLAGHAAHRRRTTVAVAALPAATYNSDIIPFGFRQPGERRHFRFLKSGKHLNLSVILPITASHIRAEQVWTLSYADYGWGCGIRGGKNGAYRN